MHATRPKGGLGIHWNFAYWPRGNVQVCIFAGGKFNFPLKRPLSVALLLLSHVFELENFFLNSEWLNAPCFQMFEERENVQIRVDYVAIYGLETVVSVLFTNTRRRWPHNEREIFNTARGVAECSIENFEFIVLPASACICKQNTN